MADNNSRDGWRNRPNPSVRPLSETETGKERELTGGDTADLRKAVSGLISPSRKESANKNADKKDTGNNNDEYRPPSVSRGATPPEGKYVPPPTRPNIQSEIDIEENSEKEYYDYINSTSVENQRKEKELQERRETKRQEREIAALTVKNPARSATFPDERRERDEKSETQDVNERKPPRAALERTGADRAGMERVGMDRQDRYGTGKPDRETADRPGRLDEPLRERREPRDSSRVGRAFENRGETRTRDEYGGDSLRLADVKFIIFGITVVILLVFIFLVVQVVNTNRRLSEANAQLTPIIEVLGDENLVQQITDLRNANEVLIADLSAANARIAELEAGGVSRPYPNGNGVIDPPYPPDNGGDVTPPPPTPSPPPTGRTHTVTNEPNLWTIAEATLGNGARWQEIIDANPQIPNLERGLQPGMVLNIPD